MTKEPTTYITIATRLPRYLPFPVFLLEMNMSQTAKLIYAILLDRTTLSQKNGWADEDGNVYIYYALDHIASDTGWSESTVKRAIKELKRAGMIDCRRTRYAEPYRIYVKLPPKVSEMTPQTGQKWHLRGVKNDPLTTKYKNNSNSNMVNGSKMVSFPTIPDYTCEEGASL